MKRAANRGRPTSRTVGLDKRWIAVAALLASALLHLGLYLYLQTRAALPQLDFAFQAPSQIDFGTLNEEPQATTTAAAATEPAAPEPPASPPMPSTPVAPDATAAAAPKALEPTPTPRPRRPRTSPRPPSATLAGNVNGGTLPPGALLALRLDMIGIRRSPIADSARQVLGAIPDWQALLNGSGIAPVDDLDRVLIASADLQRANLVVAGQYQSADLDVRAVVERMAAARGIEASWQPMHGVEAASWPSEDPTPRVVALLKPRRFVLSRPADLPRLLALMRRPKRSVSNDDAIDAAALLNTAPGELAQAEVEGARNFVRGRAEMVPQSFTLSLRQINEQRFDLRMLAIFDDNEQGRTAVVYWERARLRYANNVWIALSGMSDVLQSAQLEQQDRQLSLTFRFSAEQLRLLLSFITSALPRPPP